METEKRMSSEAAVKQVNLHALGPRQLDLWLRRATPNAYVRSDLPYEREATVREERSRKTFMIRYGGDVLL